MNNKENNIQSSSSNLSSKIRGVEKVPCAICVRKSNEEGLDQDFNSLDAQYESCRAYITSQMHLGWEFSKKYIDAGISGGTLNRPALQEMMEDIKLGKIKCIVVYKVDRLSRSLFDFSKLVEVFNEYGVSFVSITQSFNTANAMGKLMLNVLLSFALFEREVTGERIRDKVSASKKKGMWLGGNIPLGYRVENRKLIVKEDEAELVKLIFNKYLEIKKIQKVVEYLNELGYRQKSWVNRKGDKFGGNIFDRSCVVNILRNVIYIGEIKHKDKFYEGEHNGIVDKSIFDEVNELLKERAKASNMPKKFSKRNLLLTDKLYEVEGEKFICHFTKRGSKCYRYYKTAKVSLNAYEVDEITLGIMKYLLDNHSLVDDDIVSLKLREMSFKNISYVNLYDIAKEIITKIVYESDKLTMMISKSKLKDISLSSDTKKEEVSLSKVNPITIDIDEECIYLTLQINLYSKMGCTVIRTFYKPIHTKLNALVQGFKWRKMLEEGKSMKEIENIAKVNKSYIYRLIKLSYSDLITLETIIGD